MQADTYLAWACLQLWTIDEGVDTPRLLWENILGSLIVNQNYGGGSGDPNDPYLIYTADQFNRIGLYFCDWDKHFKLMANIDLSPFDGQDGRPEYNIIGSFQINGDFAGVFDGNGYSISNLRISGGELHVGLFGLISGEDALVENLVILDAIVNVLDADQPLVFWLEL